MQKRILIVDHDPMVRFTLDAALEKMYPDLLTETAEDCTEALDKARRETFDVFLLDVRVPGIGGIALTHAIRSICPDALVIWFTFHESRAVAVEAKNLGVYCCLHKPVWIAELRRVVRDALDATANQHPL